MPHVDVFTRRDGLYDWHLVADNGEIVATSGGQGYTERNDAQEGWERVEGMIWVGASEPLSAKAIEVRHLERP